MFRVPDTEAVARVVERIRKFIPEISGEKYRDILIELHDASERGDDLFGTDYFGWVMVMRELFYDQYGFTREDQYYPATCIVEISEMSHKDKLIPIKLKRYKEKEHGSVVESDFGVKVAVDENQLYGMLEYVKKSGTTYFILEQLANV